MTNSLNFNETARGYLELLLQAKRTEALNSIVDCVKAGVPLEDVYLKILQPVMYEVGRLWQTNKIDISVEHYITATTQLTMGHLFPYAISDTRAGKKMLGGCLGSELHELGMRMVSDIFELEGWDTYFLGAVTPDQSFITAIEAQKPDVVCLSATLQSGIPMARDLISKINHSMGADRPKIIVGGLAFLLNPQLAEIVGADSLGTNARDTVEKATALTN